MPYANECRIMGHLGGEPNHKTTSNDTPVANFSIATSHKRGDEDLTTWHRCVVWNEPANWTKTWQKGDLVEVVGAYNSRAWTNNEGEEVISFELTARRFEGIRNWSEWERRKRSGTPSTPSPKKKAVQEDDLPF